MKRTVICLSLVAGMLSPPSSMAALTLEERALPSGDTAFRGLVISDSSSVANTVLVSRHSLDAALMSIDDPTVGVGPAPAGCRKDSGGDPAASVFCPVADYDLILIETGAGNDNVEVTIDSPSLALKKVGTQGSPAYVNAALGPGNDFFEVSLGGGSRLVRGQGGRDRLEGSGKSSDVLIGGAGRDRVDGWGGTDLLLGGKGADLLRGGKGVPDIMIGGRGRDRCGARDLKDRVAGCERVYLDR